MDVCKPLSSWPNRHSTTSLYIYTFLIYQFVFSMYLKHLKGSYLDLFTNVMLFYLSDDGLYTVVY